MSHGWEGRECFYCEKQQGMKNTKTPQRKQRQKAFTHSGEAFLSARKTACPSH